jgi:hypothetical protein
MSKRNKKVVDIPEDDGSNWFFSNRRGGGGAPLKDTFGNSVTNLKGVLSGDTRVDHSPSKEQGAFSNPKNKFRNFDGGDDDDLPPKPRRNGGNNRDNADDTSYPSHRRGDDDSSSNKPQFRNNRNGPDADYEYNNPPPRKGIPGLNMNKNSSYQEEDDRRGEQPGPRRKGANHHGDVDPYHDDYHANDHDRRRSGPGSQQRSRDNEEHLYSNYIAPNPHSPKKRMTSLQEMHGVSNDERQEKQRRALEYQNQLKHQIDEKNRKAEKDKREGEERKRHEYQEYMHSISPKGGANANANQPDGKKKVPLFKPDDRDEPSDYSYPSSSLPPNNKKNQRHSQQHHDDDRDETDSVNDYNSQFAGNGKKKGDNNANRRSFQNDPQDGYRENHRQKSQSDNGKVVSATEYDELSKLCDKLLSQQEVLQSELKSQSHLIKVRLTVLSSLFYSFPSSCFRSYKKEKGRLLH